MMVCEPLEREYFYNTFLHNIGTAYYHTNAKIVY